MNRVNFRPEYDLKGRVHRLQLSFGSIYFGYDSEGRTTQVTDRRQLVSRFFQNVDGITTRIVNALGEESAIVLDHANNVTELMRNGNVTESMEYDSQHNLASRHNSTPSGMLDFRYSYDPTTGLLSGIASGNRSKIFIYDDHRNLTGAALADGKRSYTYTAGQLTSFTTPSGKLVFSASTDALIASMQEPGNVITQFQHTAGGLLSAATFSSGTSATYEYEPSGLRKSLTYSDGWKVQYSYDPAGNLTSTKILNPKGKQVQGQQLVMDDSYRLVKWLPFQQPETDFSYDANGNLTEMKQGKAVTRFEYDALNRLIFKQHSHQHVKTINVKT